MTQTTLFEPAMLTKVPEITMLPGSDCISTVAIDPGFAYPQSQDSASNQCVRISGGVSFSLKTFLFHDECLGRKDTL